jgi:hypothetical protein
MNTGTIGRPASHDPHQDTEMIKHATAAENPRHSQNGIKTMDLMSERLALAQMSERMREAESQRVASRLALAYRLARRSRRLHRRAERASHRARRALAAAVMQ